MKNFSIGQFWRSANGAAMRIVATTPVGGATAEYAKGYKVEVDPTGFIYGPSLGSGFDLVSQIGCVPSGEVSL